MKVKELVSIFPALRTLINVCPLPGGKAYDLAKAVKKLEPEIDAWDETRVKLCKQFGAIDPKTNNYAFGDNQAAFDAAIDEVQSRDVEVAVTFPNVTRADLGDVPIAPVVLVLLDGIVIDQAPKEEAKAPEAVAA